MTAPITETGLIVRNLGKRHGGAWALSGVNLSLSGGEVLALMGPNGAGKSTLYRLLIGAERPDRGRIAMDGIDLTDLPPHARARCGLRHLPQDPSAFRGLTVAQNLQLALEAQEPDPARRRAQQEALIDRFHLGPLRNRRPAQLSGGQRRLTEIARMIVGQPRVVLLDEPFVGLDPLTVDQVCATIRGLCAQGLGVIITDHDVRSAMALADRAIVLHAGQVLAEGPVDQVLHDPAIRGVWLGQGFRL